MAKPTPCACAMMAVLMPTTSPRSPKSGPPEFPGLIAASVWRKSSYGPAMTRPLALMIPAVTVPSRPKGLPMATTQSPTRAASESPSEADASCFLASTFTRARSVRGSRPRTLAGYSSPELVVTFTLRAFSTTWLLVRIRPSGLMTNPEPAAWTTGGGAPGRRKKYSHGVPS